MLINFNQTKDRASSSGKKLLYFRLVLVLAGISYLIFGWVYRIYVPQGFPMSMSQRVGASLFFMTILGFTYVSEWAKNHVETLMYLGAAGALSHLIYFSFINDYSLNYALSILVVIIVINFLFPGDLRLKWFNGAFIAGVGVTVFFGSDPTFNRFVYVASVALISLISYVLSRSRQSVREEYEQLFHDSPIGLVQCSPEGEIKDYNREMLRLSGDPPEEKFNRLNIFENMGIERENLTPIKNKEKRVNFPWGEEVWVEYSVELIPPGEGRHREVVIACNDITDRKKAEDRVEYITYHDDLTQLYNRSFFQEKSGDFKTEEVYPLSLIFIDVDKLKLINDAFGHQLGDELLVKASEVVQKSCREDDLVFRWGGDEIVILLPNTIEREAEKISSRIQENCEKTNFDPVNLWLSIGLTSANEYKEGTDLNHLLNEAEEKMYENKMEKQEDISREILSTITDQIRDRAEPVLDHSKRVEELALKLGRELGLKEEQVERLGAAARYHDIGKVSLDQELLNKNYHELTSLEKEEFRTHSNIGYQIAKELHEISDLAQPILQHHEWWDGTGYPQGKSGEEIAFAARIISVVDFFDFLVGSHPNYREKVEKEEALKKIKERSESQFDPEIVDVFIEISDVDT